MVEPNRSVQLVADPYPPYQFKTNTGITGVDYEIIVRSFQEVGISTCVQLLPWGKSMYLMKNGEVDGIFQITRSAERESMFIFSDILRTAKTAFFKKKASKGITINPALDIKTQLQKYRIGVAAGYSYGSCIDTFEALNRIEEQSQEDLLSGLEKGRYHIALIDAGVATYLIRKFRLKDIVMMRGFEIKRELFVAFQTDGLKLVKAFNTGLAKIRASGLFKRIFINFGLGLLDD